MSVLKARRPCDIEHGIEENPSTKKTVYRNVARFPYFSTENRTFLDMENWKSKVCCLTKATLAHSTVTRMDGNWSACILGDKTVKVRHFCRLEQKWLASEICFECFIFLPMDRRRTTMRAKFSWKFISVSLFRPCRRQRWSWDKDNNSGDRPKVKVKGLLTSQTSGRRRRRRRPSRRARTHGGGQREGERRRLPEDEGGGLGLPDGNHAGDKVKSSTSTSPFSLSSRWIGSSGLVLIFKCTPEKRRLWFGVWSVRLYWFGARWAAPVFRFILLLSSSGDLPFLSLEAVQVLIPSPSHLLWPLSTSLFVSCATSLSFFTSWSFFQRPHLKGRPGQSKVVKQIHLFTPKKTSLLKARGLLMTTLFPANSFDNDRILRIPPHRGQTGLSEHPVLAFWGSLVKSAAFSRGLRLHSTLGFLSNVSWREFWWKLSPFPSPPRHFLTRFHALKNWLIMIYLWISLFLLLTLWSLDCRSLFKNFKAWANYRQLKKLGKTSICFQLLKQFMPDLKMLAKKKVFEINQKIFWRCSVALFIGEQLFQTSGAFFSFKLFPHKNILHFIADI